MYQDPVVECSSLTRFLPEGTSRPFLALSSSGSTWVVKAHGNPQGTKSIFNEFIAGRLARLIDLPWPSTSLVRLSSDVVADLETDGLTIASTWAVGSLFIEGLRPATWPPGGFGDGIDFPRRNALHLATFLPNPGACDSLYGKLVFDNWLLLEDLKYETMQMTPDDTPVFLDGSYALRGPEWRIEELQWDRTRIGIQSPYLEGVLDQPAKFDMWLSRISSLDREAIEGQLAALPESWDVPAEYSSRATALLKESASRFVPSMQEWIDWEYRSA